MIDREHSCVSYTSSRYSSDIGMATVILTDETGKKSYEAIKTIPKSNIFVERDLCIDIATERQIPFVQVNLAFYESVAEARQKIRSEKLSELSKAAFEELDRYTSSH